MLRQCIFKDGLSCGYQSTRLCMEMIAHHGTLKNVDVALLRKGFIQEAICIIKADSFVRPPGSVPKIGWEGDFCCLKDGESPPSRAPTPMTCPYPPPLRVEAEDPLVKPK